MRGGRLSMAARPSVSPTITPPLTLQKTLIFCDWAQIRACFGFHQK
jgi:hypothetical protein